MLKFQRTKLVNIINNNDGTLAVHGTLDDHIYQIEIDVVIGIDDHAIRAIDGKWIRAENSECRRAIPFLKNAIGIKIDSDDFTQHVNKHVGRKACPHFANLIIECCNAAEDAVDMLKFETARKDQPDLTFEEYLAGNAPVVPKDKPEARVSVQPDRRKKQATKEKKILKDSNGFYVDLHIHTFPASQCSSSSVDEMLQEARRLGLDAVCVTDHNYVWKTADIHTLSEKHGILVFNGNEITTDQGDMLVFGMHKDVQGIIKLKELKQLVDDANGFIIAAHPFRGFLIFNTNEIGLTVEKAMQRPALKQVNALEVLNGKVTERENIFAGKVASGLGIPATGGSDAHDVAGVGKYATCFDVKIGNEAELVEALKSGSYTPCKFRDNIATKTQGAKNENP
ncbi:MAG: PHP domain-containing protein [Deltaproteobacteria bacterium]|jgi:predicted metal-dependent phosphoesterase TrpH|nr:PHP domain-containing protein [Deltaproteobacteria bacterium]